MYFSAQLEIDPSQITLIKKVQPTKVFAKFLHVLSLGQMSDKQEIETFTAVSILQQLNMGLRTKNIKNIIRLAVDEYDFYLDEKGVEDDLEQAVYEFKAKVDPLESELFDTIHMVLEHQHDDIQYLIEIRVKRKHKLGEYPIVIDINGLNSEFMMKDGGTIDSVKKKMSDIFSDQTKYDDFLKLKKQLFKTFITNLEKSIQKFIKVDHIIKRSKIQIIRPKAAIDSVDKVRHDKYSEPIYYGYYGFDKYFIYAWLWAQMLHTSNLYCNNFYLVDGVGRTILGVGNSGFLAGDTNTMNPNEKFEPPKEGDINYFYDNEYSSELGDNPLLDSDAIDPKTAEWMRNVSEEEDKNAACGSCAACGGCGD